MAATRRPARKSTARKSTARKPAARKATAAKKTTARKATAAKKTTARKASSGSNKAIDRFNASLEASQKAFADLRKDLQKNGSTLLKDAQLRNLEKLLKDARSGFSSTSKRLLKDLENVQKAATTGKRPAAKRGTTKPTTKAKSAAKKSASKARSKAPARKPARKR